MVGEQDTLAASLNAQYDKPISVAVMTKLSQFPFLQTLGFNGQLSDACNTFHGLEDFFDQMSDYSATNDEILEPAWDVVAPRVPLNADVAEKLYVDPTLGTVGNIFQALVGYGMVFAVNPDELQANVSAAADAVGGAS